MNKIYKTYYNSPIGIIEIKGTNDGILSIMFVDEIEQADEIPSVLKDCCCQLDEYFKGLRKEFSLNCIMQGTDFQKRVWDELTRIPFGKTVSYKDLSELIGNVKAIRAVGNANGKNLLSIVIPCHRVVGSNGDLTGYAGGIWRKEWLLKHEKEKSI